MGGGMTTGLGWPPCGYTHCHKNAQGKHPQLGRVVHMTTCKELRQWPPCVPNNYQSLGARISQTTVRHANIVSTSLKQ